MKILNYGSLNIDHVYRVPHIVRPGETLSSGDLKLFAGGKGANQSVAIAKTGVEVWHAGKVGGDAQWLLDILKDAGVHTDLVRVWDGPTGHAIIQVAESGENSIVLFGGGNQHIEVGEIEATMESFGTGDVLVLQNEINNVPEIMKAAAKKGMKIYLNPAPFSEEVLSWPLELLDTLVVNETEGMELAKSEGTPEEVLDRLTSRYPNIDIIMTAGKQGAYYGRGKAREYVPIVDAPVVDTTAAGDTFLGYYLASRIAGASPRAAMERATVASSITVSRPGAMESIPTASEVDKKLGL
jgi:ribokinase